MASGAIMMSRSVVLGLRNWVLLNLWRLLKNCVGYITGGGLSLLDPWVMNLPTCHESGLIALYLILDSFGSKSGSELTHFNPWLAGDLHIHWEICCHELSWHDRSVSSNQTPCGASHSCMTGFMATTCCVEWYFSNQIFYEQRACYIKETVIVFKLCAVYMN